MHIEATAVINRPVNEVFDFQAEGHYRNHPRWDPAVVKLEPMDGSTPALGSKFSMTRKMMGREQTDVFEIVEWKAPNRFAIETRSPNLHLRIAADCNPVEEGKTRLVVAGDAEVGGFRALLAPIMRRKLARDAQANIDRIKEMIEAEAEPSRS